MSKQKHQISITGRQGDVIVIRVHNGLADSLRGDKVPREQGRVILAHGEVTGHSHAIAHKAAELYLLANPPKVRGLQEYPETLQRALYARVPVILRHEEHGEIKLPAADYIVRRQREYHPQELRAVAD